MFNYIKIEVQVYIVWSIDGTHDFIQIYFHKRASFSIQCFAVYANLIRNHSVAMVVLPLLCEGNAKHSEVQGHNSICIPSENK